MSCCGNDRRRSERSSSGRNDSSPDGRLAGVHALASAARMRSAASTSGCTLRAVQASRARLSTSRWNSTYAAISAGSSVSSAAAWASCLAAVALVARCMGARRERRRPARNNVIDLIPPDGLNILGAPFPIV
eukprot:scaffold2963_cov112-Isochrysis_galbana.AAC.4